MSCILKLFTLLIMTSACYAKQLNLLPDLKYTAGFSLKNHKLQVCVNDLMDCWIKFRNETKFGGLPPIEQKCSKEVNKDLYDVLFNFFVTYAYMWYPNESLHLEIITDEDFMIINKKGYNNRPMILYDKTTMDRKSNLSIIHICSDIKEFERSIDNYPGFYIETEYEFLGDKTVTQYLSELPKTKYSYKFPLDFEEKITIKEYTDCWNKYKDMTNFCNFKNSKLYDCLKMDEPKEELLCLILSFLSKVI